MKFLLIFLFAAAALADPVEPSKMVPTPPRKAGDASGDATSITPAAVNPGGASATAVTPGSLPDPKLVQPATPAVPGSGTAPAAATPLAPASTNWWTGTAKPPPPSAPSPWTSQPANNPWQPKPGSSPWK